MADIASYIKAYMKKSGASFSEVKGKLEEFQKTFRNDDTNNLASIFEVKDDTNLSVEEFEQIIKSASSTGLSDFSEDDIQMFLDFVDIDDDGYYSADELGQFAYSNVICAQSLWNGILCGEVSESDVTDLGSDFDVSDTDDGSDSTVSGSDEGGTTTGSSDTDTTVDENDDGDIEDTGDRSLDKIRKQIEDVLALGGRFKTPEDVISFLVDEGEITEDEAELLRVEYAQYNDEDEATIKSYQMLLGLSKSEAIKKAEEDGVLTDDPIVSSSTEESHDLNQMAIDNICQDLYDGLRYNEVDYNDLLSQVCDDESLTPNDWVNIINTYESKYKQSLIRAIDPLYTDKELKNNGFFDKMIDELVAAAKGGNEDAYGTLAKTLRAATEGAGTVDPFLESFFNKIDNETLYKVILVYDGGVSGLKYHLKDDHLWSINTYNKYANKIDQAVNEYSRS